MDQFKNFANSFGGGNANQQQQGQGQGQIPQNTQQQGSSSGGGFFGGIGDKLNSAAGGGQESEKNEDYLDKGKPECLMYWMHSANAEILLGIDFVQEKFMGQGAQNNESAIEQAKDEQISDFSE